MIVLSLTGVARAWEVEDSAVEPRIKELTDSWEGRGAESVMADKIRRAKQESIPNWLEKAGWDAKKVREGDKSGKTEGGWTVDVDGRKAAFGVGVVSGQSDRRQAIKQAEKRAEAYIARATGAKRKGKDATPQVQAKALDWYISEKGDMYALLFGTAEE